MELPLIISRVCRESRQVACETGRMIDPLQTSDEDSILSRRRQVVKKKWFDKARDVVHLHWNAYIDAEWGVHTTRDRLPFLKAPAFAAARAGCSITLPLLSPGGHSLPWLKGRAILERISRVMVCLQTVCIHADKGPAVASGLFGRLGEEPIVLVDALDYERLSKFWALWDAHRAEHPDPLTFDFFRECHAQHQGSDAQRLRTRTICETIEDIRTQWVLDNWEEQDELRRWPAGESVWMATPSWVATRDPVKKWRQ
ncbi:hypothetical protein N0V82_000025 [Gnomoniopsis sp. IMI 355080]|nr:hypothetical protein N0V82_000025 [Gnomoniopsis sp. IMI 355080]